MSFLLKLNQEQFLEKWYDNKMVKSPYNRVIQTLTQPQVARQQQKNPILLKLWNIDLILYVEAVLKSKWKISVKDWLIYYLSLLNLKKFEILTENFNQKSLQK